MTILLALALALANPRTAPPAAAKAATRELALARSGGAYFVLDVRERVLRLKLRGVELRSYPVVSMEVGTTFWGPSHDEWMDQVYEVEPRPMVDRMEIEPPADGAVNPSATPVLPESKPDETPSAFTVRCDPDLSIRIVSEGRGTWRSLSDRFLDWRVGFRSVRLRLIMSAEDARAWHRSWPELAKLIVLP